MTELTNKTDYSPPQVCLFQKASADGLPAYKTESPLMSLPCDVWKEILGHLPHESRISLLSVNSLFFRFIRQIEKREMISFVKKDRRYANWTFENPSSLQQIKDLKLNFCSLKEIPSSIYLLKNLQSLELIKNELSQLPESLAGLQSLAYVNIDNNNFTSLPPVLTKIKSLREIHLNHNHCPNRTYSTS